MEQMWWYSLQYAPIISVTCLVLSDCMYRIGFIMDTSSFERITRLLFRCGAIAAIAQLALSVVENSDEGGIDIAMWAYTHGLTLKLWLPFVHVLNIYYRHQTSDFVGALVLIFAAFLTYIDDRNLTRSDVHKVGPSIYYDPTLHNIPITRTLTTTNSRACCYICAQTITGDVGRVGRHDRPKQLGGRR